MKLKCKICKKDPILEQGWFNIAAFMVPLCKEHMLEYVEFKRKFD